MLRLLKLCSGCKTSVIKSVICYIEFLLKKLIEKYKKKNKLGCLIDVYTHKNYAGMHKHLKRIITFLSS